MPINGRPEQFPLFTKEASATATAPQFLPLITFFYHNL